MSDDLRIFYRKEGQQQFIERFNKPDRKTDYYSIKSSTIFVSKMAKFRAAKKFSVEHNKKKYYLSVTLDNRQLKILRDESKNGDKLPKNGGYILNEQEINDIILKTKKSPLKYKILERLFKEHTTCSSRSPLISGCMINNFDKSKTYPGYKLHLKLKSRQPIINPWCSGLEKEYFLIGDVTSSDCEYIHLLGRTALSKAGPKDITFENPAEIAPFRHMTKR